jgi:hypothetical protein
MEKPKWFFYFSDGVNPGRPDDIRPYRPSGRIFHAMHEISGLIYMHMQTTARVEDPTHLVLSEPLPMPRGSIVAVDVRESALVAEHADWIVASGALLEAAYGPDEPDYSECGERLS